jgi:Fe-S-cluster containining protein
MNIKETVFNLQKVFDDMGETFAAFQKETGLNCLPGCGQCCRFPDIESTTLESLPFAVKVYREGNLLEWITRLENASGPCVLWEGNTETGAGKCTQYNYRPGVCRAFGVSGYFDKNREISLSVCKHIKSDLPELFQKTLEDRTQTNTPMISQWYSKIQSLGTPELMQRRPINEALLSALQLVGFYAQYQEV